MRPLRLGASRLPRSSGTKRRRVVDEPQESRALQKGWPPLA